MFGYKFIVQNLLKEIKKNILFFFNTISLRGKNNIWKQIFLYISLEDISTKDVSIVHKSISLYFYILKKRVEFFSTVVQSWQSFDKFVQEVKLSTKNKEKF